MDFTYVVIDENRNLIYAGLEAFSAFRLLKQYNAQNNPVNPPTLEVWSGSKLEGTFTTGQLDEL